jgi:cold shock CspA family protein
MNGTMLWFNPAKRHGFIETEDGERIRVDDDGFAPGHSMTNRCRGIAVSFDRVELSVDEPRAVQVSAIPMLVARRARLRRR